MDSLSYKNMENVLVFFKLRPSNLLEIFHVFPLPQQLKLLLNDFAIKVSFLWFQEVKSLILCLFFY